jgi:VanZ family protein
LTPAVSHFFRYQFPAIVWAIVIYVASSIPSTRLPKILVQVSDKFLHVMVFFVFGLLLYRGLDQPNGPSGFSGRRAMLALAAVIVYGLADELHQSFVPGRTLDLWDIVADSIGGALAVTLIFLFHRFRRRRGAGAPV